MDSLADYLRDPFSSTTLLIYSTLLALCFYTLMNLITFVARSCFNFWKHKQLKFKRILLVIAHPDDECMFFGPILVHLLEANKKFVYVLCLSAGGYEGKDKEFKRKKEFFKSCDVLGMNPSNVMLVNYDRMKDDPNKEWPTGLIRDTIYSFISSYDIDTIITFDKRGISGHKNHCAIYETVSELIRLNLWPKSCRVYALESVNIFRKYIINILDVWYSYFTSSKVYLVSPSQQSTIRTAMNCHQSQLTWYRYLYVAFSRYLFINTLFELKTEESENHEEDTLKFSSSNNFKKDD